MYKLPEFHEADEQKVRAFMEEYNFAVITSCGDTYPAATHIPLHIEEEHGKLVFSGHLMKNTDHHKAFQKHSDVLVIFNGPQCYVSASWYTDPKGGSTWNYMTVHARGKISFGNEAMTVAAVKKITDTYEGLDSPASFDKLTDAYVSQMVKAIVSFRIEVASYQHVFKLSQNHDEVTKNNIIQHLANGNDNQRKIADEIKARTHINK